MLVEGKGTEWEGMGTIREWCWSWRYEKRGRGRWVLVRWREVGRGCPTNRAGLTVVGLIIAWW